MGLIRSALHRIGLAAAQSETDVLKSQIGMLLRERIERHESGVKTQGGPFGAQFTRESNAKWRTAMVWDTIEQMEHDPHVVGALRANDLPLRNASWDIQPASDKPRDKEIAEFVAANLLRKASEKFGREYWGSTSWLERLASIMRMHADGFAMFSLSAKRVEAKVVFDRIHWLEPHSVDPRGWVIEGDNLIRVKRTYNTPDNKFRTLRPLEASEIALYPWDFRGARFDGTPMIRSMYGAWMRKTNVQSYGAQWAQKAGAPAMIGTHPKFWGEDERLAFSRFVQSVAIGEAPDRAYMVGPVEDGGTEPKISFAGAQHDLERSLTTLVSAENSEIAHAGSTKSDMLGETESGSRALGSTQQAREMSLIQATAAWIVTAECHGFGNLNGLIDRLVGWNYAGVKDQPVLTCTKIDPTATLRLLGPTVEGVNAGIIPNTPELRRQVTEGLGYRLADEAYEIEPAPRMLLAPNGKPPQGDEKDPTDETDDKPESVAASMAAFETRVSRLLQPSKEGAPVQGGRFPDGARSDGMRPGSGPGSLSSGAA